MIKNIFRDIFFRGIWLLVIAIVGIIFVQSMKAQEKFWVPKDPPEAHYKIDGKIDSTEKSLEGKESITFTNSTSRAIYSIAVDWSISKSSSIKITSNGKALTLLNASNDLPISGPLLYDLPEPVYPGSRLELNAKFRKGISVEIEKKEFKLIEWYPRLWWDGLPAFDSFEVKLDIPSRYAVAMSGRLNKETGYYENDGVRNFGVYLGRDLKTEQRKVEDILITSLFTEKGSECARLCLDTAADVVKFYKNWLGFYPFKFLYIIPGQSSPMGGYPFASGVVVIHGQEQFDKRPLYFWKWITAHEIGHQYWGEYVMDDDIPPWLWIGMGIYADREYAYFRNVGKQLYSGLKSRYLYGVHKHFDTTVDIPPGMLKEIKFDRNNVVVHGKGFSIISALESVLGKETFQKIYKKCLQDYGRRRLGYREFWSLSWQRSEN